MSDGFISLKWRCPQAKNLAGKFINTPMVLSQGIANSGVYLKDIAQEYPMQMNIPNLVSYGFSFFSDAQRRWFFWAKPFKYSRTNTLASNWQMTHTLLTVTISNATPYGPYVQGDDGQTRRHVLAKWPTITRVLVKATPGILNIMKDAIVAGYKI